MAVRIGLKFPAGRYHATTWGRHVNEGAVEWPPSPWRLLRTIVSAWKTRTDGNDGLLESVVSKLTGLPEFCLPPATIGHTRHYMPLYKGERTLVFDTFAAIDKTEELQAVWPEVELTHQESAGLNAALQALNYLGRAESWCEARLLEHSDIRTNCRPEGSAAGSDFELVRLLAANSDTSVARGKPPDKWPLCRSTLDLRSERWSDPPGSRWAGYWRPLNCFAGGSPPPPKSPRKEYTVARFALHSRVRPLVTETVTVGEYARQRLQFVYGSLHDHAASPVFSGKENNGAPLLNHGHAFFLPTDEDGDGHIDHLTIYAASAFDSRDLAALDSFREFRQVGKHRYEITPVLIALGTRTDLDNHKLFRKSAKWKSTTPYVPARHAKKRGGVWVDTPADQVCDELRKRAIGTGQVVASRERDDRGRRWIEYRVERLLGNGSHGQLLGKGFEIEFSEPVPGPISLGYACHFGLGQFQATVE